MGSGRFSSARRNNDIAEQIRRNINAEQLNPIFVSESLDWILVTQVEYEKEKNRIKAVILFAFAGD